MCVTRSALNMEGANSKSCRTGQVCAQGLEQMQLAGPHHPGRPKDVTQAGAGRPQLLSLLPGSGGSSQAGLALYGRGEAPEVPHTPRGARLREEPWGEISPNPTLGTGVGRGWTVGCRPLQAAPGGLGRRPSSSSPPALLPRAEVSGGARSPEGDV